MSGLVALARPCAVYSRARPRRVAFLIPAEETSPELLDSIFDFNYSRWGGRFNPIIPVSDGAIRPPYWNLLVFSDPDVVYSFVDLGPDLVRQIQKDIGPWRISVHCRQPGDSPLLFHPLVGSDQVTAEAVWPLLLERRWIGSQPRLLTCGAAHNWPHRRRVMRNFGLVDENLARRPYSDTQERISIQDDWTEATVFGELGTHQPVIFPFAASAVAAPFPEVEQRPPQRYCVVLGEDARAWTYLWNRGLLFSGPGGMDWHTLCIPTEAVTDAVFLSALRTFLQHRTQRYSGNPPGIRFVSFTASSDQLRVAAEELTRGLDLIPATETLRPDDFPAVRRRFLRWPEFERRGSFPGSDRTTLQQAAFSPSLLRTPDSDVPLAGGAWTVELRVEYAPEHKFYENETIWYKVPRRPGMARLFVPQAFSRIGADYSICADMGGEGPFELALPSGYSVIRTALQEGAELAGGDGSHATYQRVEISEKGGYARGLLSLFGGLQDAGEFFKNSFWRAVAERLSKRGVGNDERALESIRNRITKNSASILRELSEPDGNGVEWLSRFVLFTARQQHMTDESITFGQLNRMFQEQREQFIARNAGFRKDDSQEAIQADRVLAERFLGGRLQWYVESGIFRQGVRMHCRGCGSNYWREVSGVKQKERCPGCGTEVPVPVEAPWRYSLNTLVRNSIAFHGVPPVILTLHALRSAPFNDSFFYVPGLAFFLGYDDSGPAAEIDLVCIADARLLVGEVKTTASDFSQDVLTGLASLARSVNADVALIGAFLDSDGEMDRKRRELEGMLTGTAISAAAITPPAHVFEPTPHPY